MREFVLNYLDGKVEKINAPSLALLIKEHFNGSEKELKEQVKTVAWSTVSAHYIRDVQKGETKAELISADVNPFGWRNA